MGDPPCMVSDMQQGREIGKKLDPWVAYLIEFVVGPLVGLALVGLIGFIVYIPIHFIIKCW